MFLTSMKLMCLLLFFFRFSEQRQIAKMDLHLITDQFRRKTPVITLDKYRHHMRKVMHTVTTTNVSIISQTDTQWCDDFLIITGSMAEGASLARLFSPNSDTARESECDVMCTYLVFEVEEGLLHYIQNNKVFAHIKAHSSILTQVMTQLPSKIFGDHVTSVVGWEEDGLYLNSRFLTKLLMQGMKQTPNLLFRPNIVEKNCDAGSASVELVMSDVCDERDETALNANAMAQYRRLVQQIRPYYESFEANVEEMLSRLQILGEELVKMCSGKVLAAFHNQVRAKAVEWAMHSIDVTDVIFDFRENTLCRCMRQCGGVDVSGTNNDQRDVIKRTFQNYVDQLATTEDDLSVARVHQILSDIDFRVPCNFHAFQQLANQNSMYFKMLNFDQKQANDVPPTLQELSGFINRISMDLVPSVKLMFWPSVAVEWKTRDRLWPYQSVIDDIVGKGAHLVAKEFCHYEIDWRLSFSVAEIDLATRWSPVQHFVYFVFKSLFYKFIKPLYGNIVGDISANTSNKKYVASYTAKTVMMWTSESVDQSWWTEDNAAECLTVLLLALQSAFECHTLDHYFVPSVNLLEGLPDDLASRVIDAINFILSDPAAVVYQLESHFVNTDVFFNAMPAQAKLVKTMSFFMNMLKVSCKTA